MKPTVHQLTFLLVALFLLLAQPAWSGQGEDELSNLGFLTAEESETPARSPRPASRIAENVTVVTADQIEALNAHTLAEVLNTVPGIQFEQVRTPGSWAFFNIQGAVSRHIQVLIDGVPQNDLTENAPDLGLISVQHVERIEIIKGAASAAWGQALGGVVNIITKGPEVDKPVSGTAFFSYGQRGTTDARGEFTGTISRFGYFLSGGNLHSSGFLPDNQINRNSAYGKVTYDLPSKGSFTLGFDYRRANRGIFSLAEYDIKDTDDDNYGYSFVNFLYPFQNRLTFEFQARESHKTRDYFAHTFNGILVDDSSYTAKERRRGGSAKLTWGDTWRNLVMGVEYEHAYANKDKTILPTDLKERVIDRWGIYANGAVTVGNLTILPGIRFDDTGIRSNLASYTLGATYQLTDKTVLRCYGAKGYSLPSALVEMPPEQVWTVQAGAESSQIPYLWLKGTFFYNSIWDIFDPKTGLKKAEKQGVEIEVRTVPIYYLSFTAGYTYTDARNRETDERIIDIPKHSAKVALQYADSSMGLRGILTGNYVRWIEPDRYNAKNGSFVWDVSLTKRFPIKEYAPEVFFTVHNLFNDSQYQNYVFRNTGRWVEGGVRFRF